MFRFCPSLLCRSAAIVRGVQAVSMALLMLITALWLASPQAHAAAMATVASTQTAATVMTDAPGERQSPAYIASEMVKRKLRDDIRRSAVTCESHAWSLCAARAEQGEDPIPVVSAPLHLRDAGLRVARGQAPPR